VRYRRRPLIASSPAGVDLVDRLAVGHELLVQAALIAPCALDAPLPTPALRGSPFCKALLARLAVQSLPGTRLPSGVVYWTAACWLLWASTPIVIM
jgi:hypothetical protein